MGEQETQEIREGFPVSVTVIDSTDDKATVGFFAGTSTFRNRVEKDGKHYVVMGEVETPQKIEPGTIIGVRTNKLLDENEQLSWTDPKFLWVDQYRREPMFVTDVLERHGVDNIQEAHIEEGYYMPMARNAMGLTAKQTLAKMEEKGEAYTPEELAFREENPVGNYSNTGTVCGTCKFFIRSFTGEGKCHLMGDSVDVPWWYTSKGYINASDEIYNLMDNWRMRLRKELDDKEEYERATEHVHTPH